MFNYFINFSDSAKYADVARSLISELGYSSAFNFWGGNGSSGILPVPTYVLSIFFRIFGANDTSVVIYSLTFFSLSLLVSYFLGRKLFGKLGGILFLTSIALGSIALSYASSSVSEIIFIFEILLGTYLFTFRKRQTDILGFIILGVMYFTRPQAFIFIGGLALYWLLLRYEIRKAFAYFFTLSVLGVALDYFVLSPLSGRFFIYSILGRGIHATSQIAVSASPSDILRGNISTSTAFYDVFKKIFYNLYNFYKLLPQIMSPYLAGFFLLGLFIKEKSKEVQSLKIATVFMVIVTFLVAAMTIPFFRYIHPVVPLIYLFAVATILKLVRMIINDQWLMDKKYLPNILTKRTAVGLISAFLIFFFVVGQTLGVIFLDSRYERKTKNVDKPPVYVQLSWKLKEITDSDDLILTNLDTWGSWYGERKTVWYPLEPDMLIPKSGNEDPFDAIYLTSYLIDDSDYFMGDEWRQAFLHPENIQNTYLRENYLFSDEIIIPASESYENIEGRAVLLVRNSN